ncbi:hypothetical protein Celaphus_00008453, partial [Cervus elaphus hippelaphus]
YLPVPVAALGDSGAPRRDDPPAAFGGLLRGRLRAIATARGQRPARFRLRKLREDGKGRTNGG